MKIAVVAVTRRGAELAEYLKKRLPYSVDIYVKNGRENAAFTGVQFAEIRGLVKDIFRRYDGCAS